MKRHDLYRFLINFIYPNVCPYCEETIDYNGTFCPDCKKLLERYDESFSLPYADISVSYCIYNKMVRKAANEFKKDACGNTYYAFASGIYEKLKETGLESDIDFITFVPMHLDDLEERGYNQTELIAKELRSMLGVPYKSVLVKTRKTKSQKSLGGAERRSNVAGAFAVKNNDLVRGKKILLIDDICTTGSTLSENAKMLKNAGAEKVIAASFAKTVKKTKEEEGDEDYEEEYEDIL